MKSNIKRRREIFEGVLPPKGTREYTEVSEYLQNRIDKDPELQKFHKKSWEKVTRSLEAQFLSSCDFITESSLRYFLKEFNNRAWKHGLRSMPVMFNIMEAYFVYRKPEIYFELLEEENYLISFFDFIDFITSNEFEDNKKLIEENISENFIYNFNVGKDLEEIKFKNDLGDEYIVAGISIVKRENEITVLLITGKYNLNNEEIKIDSIKFDNTNPNKSELHEEMKETLENTKIDYEYLDDEKKYIKVLIAGRIDIDTMTIDARYVAKETNLTFNIYTDEIDGFLNDEGKFDSKDLESTYDNCRKMVEQFSSIFEVIKYSLYLPFYFNSKEESIKEESIETHFKKTYSNPITKKKFIDVFGYKTGTKPLYSIDINNSLTPDKIVLREDLFKIQTNGYWKKIGLDQVGLDKKGNPIHGRTWVNQNLSWFEANENELVVEKKNQHYEGENSGFIYILRNPVMGKDIFKIGLTRKNVNIRIEQLSDTSVPDKFYKIQEWNVKDCVKAEKEIHLRLNNFRVDPRREFFQVDYEKASEVIKGVIKEINQ